jgi:hypothetical protein
MWKRFLTWLDDLPMALLLAVAILAAVVPVIPEPHLWEKLKLLATGELVRPIDILDLLLHGGPLLLVLFKLFRNGQGRSA